MADKGVAVSDLRHFALIYLATPYTRYVDGRNMAFLQACNTAARLIRLGLHIYSPIAHGHPIALHGGMDPRDVAFWVQFNNAIMLKADALLVAELDGWKESAGVAHEMKTFSCIGKPVYRLGLEELTIRAV